MLPEQIGPYRIVRLLGEGGMGAVYEAIQAPIERHVALKVLLPQHAKNQDALQRFFNEARAVNLIEHPSIVQVSDYGQAADGTVYLVMERLRGEVLSQRLERIHSAGKRLSLDHIVQIAAQIADALAAAHTKSIIHRDLKPSNIMLVEDSAVHGGERVKILDFGIAKLVQGQAKGTATHALMGTPQYMSPEQCRGAGGVDEKTDVYALGVVLYEMLAGRPPFIADSPFGYISQHVFEEPSSLQDLDVTIPKEIAVIVHTLLAKDKVHRPTMRQVHTQLSRQHPQIEDEARPASRQAAASRDETKPYVPHPILSSTLGASLGQTLRPLFQRRLYRTVGFACATLTVSLVGLAGHRWYRGRDAFRSYAEHELPASQATVASTVLAREVLTSQTSGTAISPQRPDMRSSSSTTSPVEVQSQLAIKVNLPNKQQAPGNVEEGNKEIERDRGFRVNNGAVSESASISLKNTALKSTSERLTSSENTNAIVPSNSGALKNKYDVRKSDEQFTHQSSLSIAQSHLDVAHFAYVSGDYRRVISVALPVAQHNPARAWRLIGSAACNLKDLTEANNAYRHLDEMGKKYLSLVCSRNDIEIVDGTFKIGPTSDK